MSDRRTSQRLINAIAVALDEEGYAMTGKIAERAIEIVKEQGLVITAQVCGV